MYLLNRSLDNSHCEMIALTFLMATKHTGVKETRICFKPEKIKNRLIIQSE